MLNFYARCFFLGALAPGIAFGQAMTVIGDGADAESCSISAQLAATTYDIGEFDLGPCDRALEHGLMSFKNRVATFINRGIIRVANGDYPGGFNDYKKALTISPETPETYVNLGNLYLLGEKFETAVRFYSKSIELEIRQVHVALTNRGMAYEKLGKFPAAEADYRKAIELAPAWPPPQSKLEALRTRSNAS